MESEGYLEARVMTAPSHQLHLLVVEGAIRHAKQAEQALEAEDYEKAHFALSDSRQFVSELIGGLDPEQSPELVEQVKALFVYVYRNLAQADFSHDQKMVEDAIRILELHRETWLALCQKLSEQGPTESPVDSSSPSASPSSSIESTNRSWTA